MSLMVEAKIAAPLSTSCLQRWTLLQEAAQCSGVLGGKGCAVLLCLQTCDFYYRSGAQVGRSLKRGADRRPKNRCLRTAVRTHIPQQTHSLSGHNGASCVYFAMKARCPHSRQLPEAEGGPRDPPPTTGSKGQGAVTGMFSCNARNQAQGHPTVCLLQHRRVGWDVPAPSSPTLPGPHQPSLSAAFTLTPKSSRNLTMWWWPAQTALCSGVMPSSLGLLGSSTWNKGICELLGRAGGQEGRGRARLRGSSPPHR